MTTQEKKLNLLRFSANEVRTNRALFADFQFIYVAEGGNPKACMGCNFKDVFNKWQNENKNNGVSILKSKIMATNTFKMANEKEQIYVPVTGKVITKDSPDELVNEFLDQNGGKNRDARMKRFFKKAPDTVADEKDYSTMSKKELLKEADNVGFEFTDEHTNNEKRSIALQSFVDGQK